MLKSYPRPLTYPQEIPMISEKIHPTDLGGRFFSFLPIFSVYIVSFFLFAIGASTAIADISIEKTNFQDSRQVEPTETLIIRFNQFPQPDEGRLAIFIGTMDVIRP